MIYGDYRTFFTTLPGYLHDNISFVWKFIPGFLGVFLGFALKEYREYSNDLNEIFRVLPLIEFELRENLHYLSKRLDSGSRFRKEEFYTNYWEIYKDNLSDWWGNIIQLSEIYGLIKRVDTNEADNKNIAETLSEIINQYLTFLEDWYKDEGQDGGKAGKNVRTIKKWQLERFLNYGLPDEILTIVKEMNKTNTENMKKLDGYKEEEKKSANGS